MAVILLIDDDPDFCGLTSSYFTKLGYTVTVAADGEQGLAAASVSRPDLILLDIMMPQMNGIEVLRELQASDETADVPVIVISGKFFDQGMQDIFRQERNFREFVAKPVAFSQLQQKVEAAVKK